MPRIRLADFPRSFWVANVMELFERAAYYGLNSVLAIYLVTSVGDGGLGLDKQDAGLLQSVVYAAVYVLPILGGVLADKYGYRRMLLFAFSLLALGYFAAGYASTFATIFLALLVMATGAGLFKPIISGTIARTTDERTSAVGFGIFYWMINLGALVAPAIVTILRGFSWRYVFIASAAYVALMLLPTLLLYREPERPKAARTLREALLGAAEVLNDSRFMLMIVVYSGFWILYFQNLSTILYYLNQFIDTAPVDAAGNAALGAVGLDWRFRLQEEHLTSLAALTICVFGFVITPLTRATRALPTMIVGMAIGGLGFAALASSLNVWALVIGVVVFSIGEMTAQPKFYSLVAQIAPPDRKAVYTGYAFLYGVIGSLVGTNIGTFAYRFWLEPTAGTPEAARAARLFWGAFALVDVIAAGGLWLYFRAFGAASVEADATARRIMVGVYSGVTLLGVGFFVFGLASNPVAFKTLVQSGIFLALGLGGLAMSLRSAKRQPQPAETHP